MLPLLLLMMTATNDPLTPGDHVRNLTVDGRERSYHVHVPPKYDDASPTPVVLIFHGGGSNVAATIRYTGMNDVADKEGFLAVYPNGIGRIANIQTWNAGSCCGYAKRQNVDDVAFVVALLDDLEKVAKVDEKRIYATGISNGAMMSYLLASKLSDRIAAIAPVAGTMETETCEPKRPVPVIHFHGTDDQFVPFKGGVGARSIQRTPFRPVDHSISSWVKANGCDEKSTVTELPDTEDDGMSVTRTVYSGGKNGSEVVLYTVNGGGHTWPGRKPLLKFLGPATGDIDANALMWEFFQRHPQE